MPGNNLADIVCPFYLYTNRRLKRNFNQVCEGPCDRVFSQVTFSRKSECEHWRDLFCRDIRNYECCPYYDIAAEKYHHLELK